MKVNKAGVARRKGREGELEGGEERCRESEKEILPASQHGGWRYAKMQRRKRRDQVCLVFRPWRKWFVA